MNMVACHCTDSSKVIAYILLANNTNTLNTLWELVGVFSTWYYATNSVPYKPIFRNCLPLEVVVAIIVARVVIVDVHTKKKVYYCYET